MENFDYIGAIKQLEEIALKVEDPGTGLDKIDEYVKMSDELIAKCRKYLRSVREKVEEID